MNHYKIPIQERRSAANRVKNFAERQTPECNEKKKIGRARIVLSITTTAA